MSDLNSTAGKQWKKEIVVDSKRQKSAGVYWYIMFAA